MSTLIIKEALADKRLLSLLLCNMFAVNYIAMYALKYQSSNQMVSTGVLGVRNLF